MPRIDEGWMTQPVPTPETQVVGRFRHTRDRNRPKGFGDVTRSTVDRPGALGRFGTLHPVGDAGDDTVAGPRTALRRLTERRSMDSGGQGG